ncbi:tektin-2-like [Oratosquilla oratoria]|uniref:tektin-2-like n=1 Tax=Oratosquilla oratoria TaxID=337810 RepID=UPI003F762322
MEWEKPLVRFLPEDWDRNNATLRKTSEDQRYASHDLRQETTYVRNQTTNKTAWDLSNNTTRLEDRVKENNTLKEDLERSLRQVREEVARLEEAKRVAEQELEAHQMPLKTALESLMLRERRREIDLVKDEVEEHLHKEIEVLQRSRADLEKKVLEAVSHLRVLHEARQKLEDDIRDKEAALGIDRRQAVLTIHDAAVSFKPDATRIPTGTVLPAAWMKNSQDTMAAAENAVRASEGLRDATCVAIQTALRNQRTQQAATNYALRRRLHQETRARDELQWQKDKLLGEIREAEEEVKSLEEQLRDSTLPLKLAQTRLENRTARVRNELVRDAPQEGLTEEVAHLITTRDRLRDNLEAVMTALHSLQRHLRVVDEDLGRKNLSVSLEKKVQDVREALGKRRPPQSLTEANMTVTGTLRSHPVQIL